MYKLINQKGFTKNIIIVLVAVVIIAGLSLAYVKYVKPEKNENKNTNTVATNTNTIKTKSGDISLVCSIDTDCVLINIERDYTTCCSLPSCTDYSEDKWQVVNQKSFTQIINEITKGKDDKCKLISCPKYMPPNCPDNNNDKYKAQCIKGKCLKKIK